MIRENAKTILCFGDSNTWGAVPRSDDRHPRSARWPSVLQGLLGDGYEVLSEGLPGRTLVAVEPGKPHRTGITHLRALLESADPVDLVILMLGTNDMKSTFNLSGHEIASHLEETVRLMQDPALPLEKTPKILVVCPPPVVRPAAAAGSREGSEHDARMVRAVDISKELPALFAGVARERGCEFMDAGRVISSSPRDGYHLEAEAHRALAAALAERVAKMI